MEFSIKLHTMNSEWSIVYIEESPIIISKKKNVYISQCVDFALANGADLIKYHLSAGSSLFVKGPISGFPVPKWLNMLRAHPQWKCRIVVFKGNVILVRSRWIRVKVDDRIHFFKSNECTKTDEY